MGKQYLNAMALRTMVALLAVITISACSFKTVYNQLDFLIPQYVEDMVSLDEVLEAKLEQRTLVLISWHRNTQLLQYADWLRGMQQQVNDRLTQQQVEQSIAELEKFWRSLSVKLNNEMAVLLPLLNQQQQLELFASMADKNEDFREKFVELDDAERIEAYYERLYDNYENWVGDLTETQEHMVQQAATALVSSAELRLQRRLQWQFGIQKILASSLEQQPKIEQLGKFLAGFEQRNSAMLKHQSLVNRRVITELTVQLAHSLSAKQKAYFMERTNDYIRMFTELAAQQ